MPEPEDAVMVELDAAACKSLRRFARSLDREPYGLLLVGDGAGETYRKPAGWACLAYDRGGQRAVVHAGGLTAGTNSFSELLPYLHALSFFDQAHKDGGSYGHRIAIVSDSRVTVRSGNRLCQTRAKGCLWAGIEWFERNGYVLRWHHVRRRSSVWNDLVDTLADVVRSPTADLNLVARREAGRLLPEG